MQNLLAVDILQDHLLLLELDESVGPFTISLKKLFIQSSPKAGLRNVINPKSFFGYVCAKAPQFKGYQQHDSHEMLRCLLDGLYTEELSVRKQTISHENGICTNLGPTFVVAIFGGQLSSTVSCLECGHSSTVFEPFLDLSLPVLTKKPPSKRAQPISRGKKSKLPPKRSGRTRPKVNKDGNSIASGSVFSPFSWCIFPSCAESSSGLAGIARDNVANSALSEPNGPAMTPDKKTPVLLNILTAEEFEKNHLLKNVTDKTEASLDNSICLDNLQPDSVSNDYNKASKTTDDIAVKFNPIKNDTDQIDASLQAGIESSRQVHLLCNVEMAASLDELTWLDYLEPASLSDEIDIALKVDDVLTIQDFGSMDAVQLGRGLKKIAEPGTQVNSLYTDTNLKVNPSGNSFENELPIQVQASEALLLPHKEETSTNGEMLKSEDKVSSSAAGCELDALDFDGFGGLFHEPDVSAGPNVKPLSSDNKFQENEIAETASSVRNSSESDPDEVDNSDSPVSIESCLACFTKRELLSNEHAWHCENCSEALREQRLQSRKKKQKATSKTHINGFEDRIQSGPPSSATDCPCRSESRKNSCGDHGKDVLKGESMASGNGKIDAKQDYKNETS